MPKFSIKAMVQIGFLIGLEIILSRFASIATPLVKIGFAFLPIAIVAMLHGPFYGGLAAAMGDFLGAILFPIGAYFPGFTLTAFLTGMVYGTALYKRPKSWLRVSCTILFITLVLHLGLNTVWLWMITGKGYLAILPTRLMQAAIMLPIQTAGVYFAGQKFCSPGPFSKMLGIKLPE
ncbi:folate family ECF transporter S component [Oscillospiraceae bacterium MB08-C2-2]|nr:folate family ECF transporter S component [Oscillospiraceae bacterium MB08-C2-2]